MTDPGADDAAQTLANALFAVPARFVTSAADLGGLPAGRVPEIAFAGRSNVGKSSLLNALTGVRGLAKTSNTPGRTRLLNFFDLGGGRAHLVDLPGYGYARASKKDRKVWTRLTEDYLRGRPNLVRVYQLIDIRHGLKDSDRAVAEQLSGAGISVQFVLTKADKVSRDEQEKAQAELLEASKAIPSAYPGVLVTSAEKGWGIGDLRLAAGDALAAIGIR